MWLNWKYFLGKIIEKTLLNRKGDPARRPAGHNAGLDISLFALCSARPGGPGREGSSTCLWRETAVPVLEVVEI